VRYAVRWTGQVWLALRNDEMLGRAASQDGARRVVRERFVGEMAGT